MDKFKDSEDRFHNIDGKNFGACLREVKQDNIKLQFRQRLSTGEGCWVQIWAEGKGYQIYEPEKP